ncbi:MAG: beta-galactosidase [Gluconobacter potus]|uniref:Beta-galactosidase n=1 Tax=Gluconobacter potus TaxID=2724927 RepID=A0ABR9YIQ5_9PROT|nr:MULTISPECIES: beta-galactosidase [Gluconobacter]MBF0863356.1 beta-galactosidase [Gluconobacter sp. R71656]MBF0867510.1 beta-galactosidase [Gluconobacter sp. R75628]MBF0873692.1 beta-galactosidase [Gluconobacter sp. R75629]MBF0881676.1 beta-galactosidase [Gluconobacter potus]
MYLTRRSAFALGFFSFGHHLIKPVCAAEGRELCPDGQAHSFTLHPEGFRLDGVPMQIRSGEMHPARIPREEWSARIAMAKSMGLNTISIYVIWNILERSPGHFDFHTDRCNFPAFIQLCQDAGLWVFLRPGPYICGEWDLGGLPAYLLFDEDIPLRTRDPRFLKASQRYITAIASSIRPYMAVNGGPIIMIQVENEYASFGNDRTYMAWIREAWLQAGISGPFSTADGLPQLTEKRTALSGCAIGLDGEDDISGVKNISAQDPAWISEAYPGWLTHWGENDLARVEFTKDFSAIVAKGLSFNLYVVHGGTNFGFGAGANAHRDGSGFQPVITSYDYDAPIDEAGRPTKKYYTFRNLLISAGVCKDLTVPELPPMTEFKPVKAYRAGSLWEGPGIAVVCENPVSMERALHQGQGMALYQTTIPAGMSGMLELPAVHDYARFFLDGADIGTVSRTNPRKASFVISEAERPRQLDILIDTFGHIGYGAALGDRKGLEGQVSLGGKPLRNWIITGFPLDDSHVSALRALPDQTTRYGFLFKAYFDRPSTGGVYIDMSAWKKGYVWVNGHALGRFWEMGPQYRLFCPASWMRSSGNEVLILDYHQENPASVRGYKTLTGL